MRDESSQVARAGARSEDGAVGILPDDHTARQRDGAGAEQGTVTLEFERERGGRVLKGDEHLISNSFLQAARKDLAAEYDELSQPDRAAEFRAEYAAAQSPDLKPSATRRQAWRWRSCVREEEIRE